MVNMLQKIVATKKQEVANAKLEVSVNKLLKIIEQEKREAQSLVSQLHVQPGIIAEFKRASPSKGVINAFVEPEDIIKGYDKNGALGMSVLTDKTYFQAKQSDFTTARKVTNKPILRKEFIIDSYQIYQSKAMGADVILLIAAILTKTEIAEFTKLAHHLNLEVLMELHAIDELDKLCGNEDLMGVNNRNLKTFKVDINQSILIKNQLGQIDTPLISESGISSITQVKQLLRAGFRGFLMGEYFIKQSNPIQEFTAFNKLFQTLIENE